MSDETICVINAGVCGMTSKIKAKLSEDMMSVDIEIESNCPMVQKLSPLNGLNPYEIVGQPFTESPVYVKASECLRHTACPVPSAIIKCAEAASGMALKKPVTLEWQ